MFADNKYFIHDLIENEWSAKYTKRGTFLYLNLVILFSYTIIYTTTSWTTEREILISISQFIGLTLILIIAGPIPALLTCILRTVTLLKNGIEIKDIETKPFYHLVYPKKSFYDKADISYIKIEKEIRKRKGNETVYININAYLNSEEKVSLFWYKSPFTRHEKNEAFELAKRTCKTLELELENNLQHGL